MEIRKKINKALVSKYVFLAVMMFYPITMFLIFWLGKNVQSILLAFQKISPEGITTYCLFDNFQEFFTKFFSSTDLLGRSILNTLKLYFWQYLITIPLNFILSYYLFKKLPLHGFFRIVAMAPSIISGYIMALVFKKFVDIGVPNVMHAIFNMPYEDVPNLFLDSGYAFWTMFVYMIWTGLYMVLLVYPNSMRSISTELFESAQIDGCSWGKEFIHIIFPLMYPTFSTMIIVGAAAFFDTTGAATEFYMWNAPNEVVFIGYYYTRETIVGKSSMLSYPMMAAGGLVLSVLSGIVVFAVKWMMERFGPSTEF